MSHTLPDYFAVFGDPIAHSRSPAMHMAAFRAMNLPHQYLAFRVRECDLWRALEGARTLGFCGLNLTVPLKRKAVAMMDALSEKAQRIGAINTVSICEGKLLGDNTDSSGFATAVRELGEESISKAIVLGAGGAAWAVIDALLHDLKTNQIMWVSRQVQTLAQQLPPSLQTSRLSLISYEELRKRSLVCDLLVNCTTVGMAEGPKQFPIELELSWLSSQTRIVDLVYPAPPGGLVEQARALGAKAVDGRSMLLWQGVFALEKWLGRSIPESVRKQMAAAI